MKYVNLEIVKFMMKIILLFNEFIELSNKKDSRNK